MRVLNNIHFGLGIRSFRVTPYPGWPSLTFWQKSAYPGQVRWPRLSIITPSYNQAPYLETTILSVLNQHYPNLEYIIIDGGSSDGSLEVIRKYDKHLHFWVSEKDLGQSNAINKGMAHATGEWVAWINSDDYYLPNAFRAAIQETNQHPGISWIAGNTLILRDFFLFIKKGFTYYSHLGKNPFSIPEYQYGSWLDFICTHWTNLKMAQPSSFWKREMWDEAGGLDEDFHYAMDHELYTRFAYAGFRPHLINRNLSVFRRHSLQKENQKSMFIKDQMDEVEKWLSKPISTEEVTILKQYRAWLNPLLEN